MLCNAILCYAMLCYAMLCYAMLCYAMLCYAHLGGAVGKALGAFAFALSRRVLARVLGAAGEAVRAPPSIA
jgi:hypothetical protein